MTVKIIKPMGPVYLNLMGIQCKFERSYLVDVPNVGFLDQDTGQPIVYPAEFLFYAKPPVAFERSSWEDFDKMILEVQETTSSNTIKNGVQSNGQEL